jgi:hypothetical protein
MCVGCWSWIQSVAVLSTDEIDFSSHVCGCNFLVATSRILELSTYLLKKGKETEALLLMGLSYQRFRMNHKLGPALRSEKKTWSNCATSKFYNSVVDGWRLRCHVESSFNSFAGFYTANPC